MILYLPRVKVTEAHDVERRNEVSLVTVCFACEGPADLSLDRPGSWLVARHACPAHAQAAALPTGEGLAAFLGRRRTAEYPLEGSGLNWVINPARVEGHRAWLDFHFAWPAVYEEVFASTCYFDYLVQHVPQHVTLLYHLSKEARPLDDAPPVTSLLRALARDPLQGEAWSILSGLWAHQVAVDALLTAAGKGFVETPEEAEAVAEAGFEVGDPDLADMARRLGELASARFAHLG